MSFCPSQKRDNSVHTILLKTLPRKRRKRRKMARCCALAGRKLFIFDNMKKNWDSLFAVPDFSVRSSKSNVLRYRWMSVKTTNGTREGLGRSEKNRRPFKHYWGCYRYFTLFIVKVQEILLWLLIISAYDEKHARHIFLHRFRLFKNIK